MSQYLTPDLPPNTIFRFEDENHMFISYNPRKPKPYLVMYFSGATRRLTEEQAAQTTEPRKEREI